ncbi:3-deoxy-manno-octulosonate cytidylyltransferase [Vibrio sp. S4M6]|uniref:3-deoxy-manno-octulosonate cytidylyltransferase n=1 Tax=Vibrio sinus TaxID=2946865 RepID=UPI00202A5E02|nr:3-deoxy-manno-octulosonate cytidylyltransferase [Vibrio sinus]MCL9780957.1 3-deoxy-manno-octulosonate cytidylyltransferase [Vibrio sinus]
MKKVLIIIPARYGSTRLPGKPMLKIAGREMLLRVADIAHHVCSKNEHCDFVIATDDECIGELCKQHNIAFQYTSEHCKSGTERCYDLIGKLESKPDFIINLQGDNPLCPPWFIQSLIDSWSQSNLGEVFTPFVRLNWDELNTLRETKAVTPFSGTTVQVDKNMCALTFSKNIVPAIRKEQDMQKQSEYSPVLRHIGLYGYTLDALKAYLSMDESLYEQCEGLEQMRFVENAVPVKMVEVSYQGRDGMSGVDSPEDIERAEKIIAKNGEFDINQL